eukprot:scaffold13528_cov72-Cyclotella_meneghiniana.AAC.3
MKFANTITLLSQASANLDVNPGALEAAIACNQELGNLNFVFLEDEAVVASIEDDVRLDLAAVGFNVQCRRPTLEQSRHQSGSAGRRLPSLH